MKLMFLKWKMIHQLQIKLEEIGAVIWIVFITLKLKEIKHITVDKNQLDVLCFWTLLPSIS